MISSKYFNALVAVAAAVAVLFTTVFLLWPEAIGVVSAVSQPSYTQLFDQNKLMSVNILADEKAWAEMLENATAEEYISCDIQINGTTYYNVGIRPKGNSSLSQVASSDSDRFSFKVEFDHYVDGQSCQGLDKLVLNNNISDATYMKEYLAYDLMDSIGVDTPLCSYAQIQVNSESWGLYLAVEALEESFAQRNFGADYGSLYKPDSMGMGDGGKPDDAGGKMQAPGEMVNRRPETEAEGNEPEITERLDTQPGQAAAENPQQEKPADGMAFVPMAVQTDAAVPQSPDMGNRPQEKTANPNSQQGAGTAENPSGSPDAGNLEQPPEKTAGMENAPGEFNPGGDFMGGPGGDSGGGSDLKYTNDDPDSYSDIFDSAVFDITSENKTRVITALKNLNDGTDLETYLDVDEVLRYFAANTVLVNFDSYVGNLKHNYYLYEKDGQLSILPWDFNLAFAGFQTNNASAAVNSPVDTPVSGTMLSERPLIGKLLEVEEYKEKYHGYLQEIVDSYFNSGRFTNTINQLDQLISGSVAADPTAFYTCEQYQAGVETLKTFGLLRSQSIAGQLDGSIPSTSEEQSANPGALVDASSVQISAMGSQGGGGGMGGEHGQRGEEGGFAQSTENREQMRQAMAILQGVDGDLTQEQQAQLADLGLTEEQIEQFTQMAQGRNQGGGMGRPGNLKGDGSQGAPSAQQNQISAETLWLAAACTAAMLAGLFGVMVSRRRRKQTPIL